ncbi:aminoglycoside 3'-phosphotransferase [Streptomyces sp. NRRL B-24484]|uniref:aminoglycoside 3'-phosphotransferase n=1 Tax=Streptomyces sp. NRRL B-24484 TaxID=1463833 RepID=UPI0004C09A67|nr:aminoglycoside 3'-phosphotransferase [Streptomyces sp. NRRL B-24484]
MIVASEPRGPVAVPPSVVEFAAGRPVRPVWRNLLGGLTFQVGADGEREFVKWLPAGAGRGLEAEAVRLRWAARFTAVPVVLAAGSDEDGSWLATAGLPGRSAVDDRWLRDPAMAVRAVGEGLRALHEALPVDGCPFDWSAGARLGAVRARAAAGLIDPADRPEGLPRFTTVDQALRVLEDVPPPDGPAVCHGDACAPNTLVGDDGRWTGHVDLGALGAADRWADLAVATWSTVWNYGPGWEKPLLDAYGIAPDGERTAYYRLLWHLSD